MQMQIRFPDIIMKILLDDTFDRVPREEIVNLLFDLWPIWNEGIL